LHGDERTGRLVSPLERPKQFGNGRCCGVCGAVLSRYSNLRDRCALHREEDTPTVEPVVVVAERRHRSTPFYDEKRCPQGHLKTAYNVWVTTNGKKRCRRCRDAPMNKLAS
jgi:hypothetical protein